MRRRYEFADKFIDMIQNNLKLVQICKQMIHLYLSKKLETNTSNSVVQNLLISYPLCDLVHQIHFQNHNNESLIYKVREDEEKENGQVVGFNSLLFMFLFSITIKWEINFNNNLERYIKQMWMCKQKRPPFFSQRLLK